MRGNKAGPYRWAESFLEKVKKTFRGGVVNLSVVKERPLDSEFENLQRFFCEDEEVTWFWSSV
ncbi:MAG: hypothetical protein ACLFUR_03410 [Candidatus Hadarchaeia archaeon]